MYLSFVQDEQAFYYKRFDEDEYAYVMDRTRPVDVTLELSQQVVTFSLVNKKKVKLPKLPDSLSKFECEGINIEKLPYLPDSIHDLIIVNLNLYSIDKLPVDLSLLVCCQNKLTLLPTLH